MMIALKEPASRGDVLCIAKGLEKGVEKRDAYLTACLPWVVDTAHLP
jgi:hypothetical protein